MNQSSRFSLIIFFVCALIALVGNNVQGYTASSEARPPDSLRVGLVLSGGGALGIAHIGVIEAIEEAGIRIDYITGTSMGSLVGGLYSIGYTSDQLAEMVLSNNFNELFTEKPSRKYISNYEKLYDDRTIATFPINEKRIDLPLGILSGHNVYTYLSRLTWHVHGIEEFTDFPIPFAAVATDLETGEARVFKSGYLPDALRASISIPSIFRPHEIDGKLYVDGGLIRNIPVEDVIEMGADYTIAVDVSSPLMTKDSLNTLASVLNQSIFFRIHDYSDNQRAMADYVVRMDELEQYTAADFNLAERFLEIGRKAGQEHLEKFKEIAARQMATPRPRDGVGEPEALRVNKVVIEGNSLFDDDFIRNQLEFIPGNRLSPSLIEDRVTKLYSSQYIDDVTYRMIPDSSSYTLQVNIDENNTDEFNVGLRYESGLQASILLEGNFQNLLHNGSLTRFEARLGDRRNFQADHIYYGALGSDLALLTSLRYMSENVDWFASGRRVSRFQNEVIRTELSGANYLSTTNLIALGIRKDYIYQTNRINPEGIGASKKNYHSVFLRFIRDNLNRRSYPTYGRKFVAEGFYSDKLMFSNISFSSFDFYYEGYYRVDDDLSLKNSVWAGYTTGRDLPWEYWKTPNRFDSISGLIRFGGLERYEVSARNIQMVSAGFQLEPFFHRFFGLDIYAGRFLNNWNLNTDNIEYGVSLSVGALTIIGPVKLIFSNSSLNDFMAELQIGYRF